MIVSTIPSVQPAHNAKPVEKTEGAEARKRADEKEEARVRDRKITDEQQAALKRAEVRKVRDQAKPVVNAQGEQLGKVINTTA